MKVTPASWTLLSKFILCLRDIFLNNDVLNRVTNDRSQHTTSILSTDPRFREGKTPQKTSDKEKKGRNLRMGEAAELKYGESE